ncbi:hypothetical protein [Ralstonia holmesii]|uniref:hypothetical protein n=1 Tax=Ralstonia holmesii TaxID=3058602 RepID=UPI0028F613E5|nr:hypothetical protein [Ralstonia sp. LMG 32967]CAJ0705817.1 hypothetical protein R11007_04697 [Ralstonia sp. LMG 32967]
MSIDAYKIAVQISLVENVTRGLATLSRYFKAADTDAKALEGRIAKIGKMAAAGGILAAAGAGGLKLLQGPLEEAKKYQTELERFRALGLGDVVTSQADKFAKGMNVMGQSARDNMKLLREATSIMGDFGHAQEVVPLLAKMKFGLESVMGEGHASKFEQMFQSAIKVTELRGALVDRETGHIDTAKFSNALNMMTQAYVASGGLVKPQDYLAAIKTGGVSAKMMTPEMFFFGLGHFMQESGGSRTGTAAMSMFQNWAMGRMPQRIAERMAGLGLLDPNAIHYGKTGHITGVDPEGIIRSKEFTANPFKYVNDVVVPLLKQKGFSGDDLNMQLASLFGIRTASNLSDQFVREQKIADLYTERAKKAAGITGLYDAGGKTMAGKELDLEAKFANLKLELGQKILPLAVRGLELLIGVLDHVTSFAKEFPGLTKAIVLATAALSGLMLLGGGLLLLKAAISGFALLNLSGIASGLGPAGVAGGLAGLAKAAGVFMAAYAGWKAGGWLNDNVINPLVEKASGVKGATLGTWLYDVTHPNEGKNLTGSTGSPHVKTDAGRPINVHVTGKVDGRTLMQFMAEGQAKELARPPTGPTTFDPSMGLRPSALR